MNQDEMKGGYHETVDGGTVEQDRAVVTPTEAFAQKGLPHIPNRRQPACRFGQAQIYHMDNIGGINFLPIEYVNTAEVFETKKRMLSCHQSQVTPMKELANTDMLEMLETQARFRGLAAGCKYAEEFRRVEAYQRGLTHRVLP